MDGILPIDKPVGITSYDAIRQVKKLVPKGTKIGHAGTLDPFARGVLLILLGKATKRFDEIQGWKKTYRAIAKLGAKSDTLDSTGVISEQEEKDQIPTLQRSDLCKVTNKYVGVIEQKVPAYAAAKYKGRKLYEYAREGTKIPEKHKQVTIYEIEILGVKTNEVEMRVVCSSGTYIRQLSYDIFKSIGIESYLESLTRTIIGDFVIEKCCKIVDLDTKKLESLVI